jgi:hypothetical protein
LCDLLQDDKGATDFVFVIDALDKCDLSEEPEDLGKLLNFMNRLIEDFPNVQMLCSSQLHVPIQKYFSDEILYKVCTLETPAEEIQHFICNEIENQRKQQRDSIFCK